MGITRLKPFLRKRCPEAFLSLSPVDLAGRRLAVDGSNLMYILLKGARTAVVNKTDVLTAEVDESAVEREWLRRAGVFFREWLAAGVTPVVVFDGAAPEEKKECKEKRRGEKVGLSEKIKTLSERLRSGDVLSRPVEGADHLRRLLSSLLSVSPERTTLFRSFCSALGLPVLSAVSDAERLCSALALEGRVAAVYSTDTDNLALGCPLLLTGPGASGTEAIRLDAVLDSLSLSHRAFVDLCILSGCDYNRQIPGIGCVKAYKLLLASGSIDNLPPSLDVTCLKHRRCRSLFAPLPSPLLSSSPLFLDLSGFPPSAREMLDSVGLGGEIGRVAPLLTDFPSPNEEPLPLGLRSFRVGCPPVRLVISRV